MLAATEQAVGSDVYQAMEENDRIHRDLFGVNLHVQVQICTDTSF